MNSPLEVNTSYFQGPINLLIELIKKEDMEIGRVILAELTEWFLEEWEHQTKSITTGIEFLDNASSLIWLKSVLLLPQQENTEEEAEAKPELDVHRERAYRQFVDLCELLKQRQLWRSQIFTRPVPQFADDDYVLDAGLFDLVAAFQQILTNRVEEPSTKEIIVDELTVQDRIKDIAKALSGRRYVHFSSVFGEHASRQELIVTFLAVLELIKTGKIFARQPKLFGDIRLYANGKAGIN